MPDGRSVLLCSARWCGPNTAKVCSMRRPGHPRGAGENVAEVYDYHDPATPIGSYLAPALVLLHFQHGRTT
jgi:hypothetical protein